MSEIYSNPELTSNQVATINSLRDSFSWLQSYLNAVCPNGRHRSLAQTALEESFLWAVRSVTLSQIQNP